MTDFDTIDYFTDPSLVPDPHPYFDHLRSRCPVVQEPHYGVLAVTGYEEAATVLKDSDTFSSCIAVAGPFPPLPFTPRGTTSPTRSPPTGRRCRCSSTW